MELAAMTVMDLEDYGIAMRLEPSPKNLRGLTHREWGDYTETMPILMETGNPVQGRLRGKTDARLALTGVDKAYVVASDLGRLYIPDDGKQTIEYRAGRHTESILVFRDDLELLFDDRAVVVEGVPGLKELEEKGLGFFLTPATQH
ncbi:MAG: hypothetical protein GX843_06295 [Synergistaceae bacterium]|nr:hypothetical protein [Synergistaceae bacterium]